MLLCANTGKETLNPYHYRKINLAASLEAKGLAASCPCVCPTVV